MSRLLYVAEPIDQSDFGSWKESISSMIEVARKQGWIVYRPSHAFSVHHDTEPGYEIEGVNRYALAASDAVLAHIPRGVPTIGVPREVEWARMAEIPTCVATDGRSWSLQDVDVIEIGDVPGFGMWIKAVPENAPHEPTVAFTIDSAGAQLPTRTNEGDAGFDLYISEYQIVPPGEFKDIPCGIRVALPGGVWARITGRSSTLRKRGLLVAEGVIDNGYRGPLYSGVWNLTDHDVQLEQGERIAQLILHENISAQHTAVRIEPDLFDRIPSDGRGDAGFGSSGF